MHKIVQFSITVSHILFVLYCLSALPIFANEPLLKYTMRSNCQSEIAFTAPPPFFPSPLYVHNDRSLIECFHSRGQHLCKFLGTKGGVCIRKELTPTGFVWDTNMAAVSLSWDTNMAAVTSCKNTLYPICILQSLVLLHVEPACRISIIV